MGHTSSRLQSNQGTGVDVTDFTWCIAETWSQKERPAVDKLAERGVVGLVPLHTDSIRRHRRGKGQVPRQYPLMSGYVLLGLEDVDQIAEVRRLPNIFRGYLQNDEKPVKVRPSAIEWLINHWPWYNPPGAPIRFTKQVDAFREGGKVLIRSGPFSGHHSEVLKVLNGKRVGDPARARIVLELLGARHEVTVDVETLLPQD